MAARAKKKSPLSRQDAAKWRRFLTHSPPLTELIEIRRLHDTKSGLRRRGDLPPAFATRSAEWRWF